MFFINGGKQLCHFIFVFLLQYMISQSSVFSAAPVKHGFNLIHLCANERILQAIRITMPNAIITGATQGIGKAIAEKFLSQGYNVAVCARSQPDLDLLHNEWRNRYPKADILTLQADLSKKEEVMRFAKNVLTQFPAIDILVNNAGLY